MKSTSLDSSTDVGDEPSAHRAATAVREGHAPPARPTRSKEALAVTRALHNLVARGLLGTLVISKMRDGQMSFRIRRHVACAYCLVLDLDANALLLPRLLRGVGSDGRLLRSVDRLLHALTNDGNGRQLLDPSKSKLRVFMSRGALTVQMSVLSGDYEYCTTYLVAIAHDILRRFTPHAASPPASRTDA